MTSKLGRSIKLVTLSAGCLIRSLVSRIRTQHPPIRSDGPVTFVIHSIIPWSGVWQRPQHLAVRLAETSKVLYIDPVGLQHVIAAGDSALEVLTRVNDSLAVFRPRVLPGGKTRSGIIRLNDALILADLQRILNLLNMTRPVLITNTPLADSIARRFQWETVAYDVIDDFIAASWAPPDAGSREQALFAVAGTVFTGTYSLWEKKRSFHPDVEFIPCGVEVEHFLKATDPALALPDDVANLPRPVFGYFGGLNERLDTELLRELAEAFPEGSVVLIGPVFADFGLSRFTDPWASVLPDPSAPGFGLKKSPSSIHILGIRPYTQLPAYLKAFDVCLLPYVLNRVTRDIHPVKILEYLAAGRPVVSTALPDVVRFYSDIVAVTDSHSSFIEACRNLAADPAGTTAAQRIEFARTKTWETMSDRMRAKIEHIVSAR
ncbi:glycosyltransferase [bacterium]|nr:glycosyltransferase [candidate division CSSED10-310 bacterium]